RGELNLLIDAAREEERLLARLLSLRRGEISGQDAVGTDMAKKLPTIPADLANGTGRHPALEAAVQELAVAARPVHISDLMRLLHDRNISSPGAGAQANLIAPLRRDKRVIRPSRGMYGLAVWGLQEMP